MGLLTELGMTIPVVAAPMAGGPTTPSLVAAAVEAGGFGFLAGGYQTPTALGAQLAEVRVASRTFGVNVFAPNPVPVDPAAFREYRETLQHEADRFGLDLSTLRPDENDDYWRDKVDLLLAEPVPAVSFTFGIPEAAVITALRRLGTLVIQTVTTADEARAANDAGVDVLAVQAAAAGGHSGTLTPMATGTSAVPGLPELVAAVRYAVALPVVAAGGVATAADVRAALIAGADAVMVGTVLLRAPESGTSAPYRAALARAGRETVVTRAFTGRPARGLRNQFIDRYDQVAPSGYPAIHHLTSPLRKAAAAAGDAELVNLWAGAGYRQATDEPVAAILARLAPGTPDAG